MKREESLHQFLTEPIYCILGEALCLGRGNIETARQVIDAGVKVIQYREKHKSWREKYSEASQIAAMCHDAGVTFIMNDSVDLAIACGADGIHVGQRPIPSYARWLAPMSLSAFPPIRSMKSRALLPTGQIMSDSDRCIRPSRKRMPTR